MLKFVIWKLILLLPFFLLQVNVVMHETIAVALDADYLKIDQSNSSMLVPSTIILLSVFSSSFEKVT